MPDKIADILMLLDGEETVSQLGRLHLTNLRLAYSITLQKGTETGIAMIRDIDSIVILKIRSSLSLVIVGAILIIFGLMILSEFGRFSTGYGVSVILIGTIMMVVYFLLKEKAIQFTLNGKEWVSISTHQLGSEEMIIDFVNKLFEMKSKLDNVTKPVNPSSLISF